MKIAILGGGFTGLTAGYYLSQKNQITIFEKENVLGGLSSGFNKENWDWSLEKTYHHLFANDGDILNFIKETGFKEVFFQEPETASLFGSDNYRIFPVDTPQDFLKLPFLNLIDKFRSGAVIAGLRLSPMLRLYEKETSKEFLRKTMGDRVWNVLWQELFRKKFGKYAENILASFIWARVKKRTKKLGYINGGFQNFIDYLEKKLEDRNAIIEKNYEIATIQKTTKGFLIGEGHFDLIISTLPTPVLIKFGVNIFPNNYLQGLKKIKYLHAVSLILETKEKILDKTYWLNINAKNVPFVALVQHTNMIDKKRYGDNNILYVANYVDEDNTLLKMNKEEILNFYLPSINKIKNFKLKIENYYLFKSLYAQPVFDRVFLQNKPDFKTPEKNFYIANLDMTYPFDRGTNYAVKLGKEISKIVNS